MNDEGSGRHGLACANGAMLGFALPASTDTGRLHRTRYAHPMQSIWEGVVDTTTAMPNYYVDFC